MDNTLDKAAFAAAIAHGKKRGLGPHATGAHYDMARDRVIVELSTGIEISFSPKQAEGLENANSEELSEIQTTPSGLGLHFPRIDADIYVPAMLEGILGSTKWMAGKMGRIGGQSRSTSKSNAARENGKKGGRPRKSAA